MGRGAMRRSGGRAPSLAGRQWDLEANRGGKVEPPALGDFYDFFTKIT